jgi:hypothetical protein
MRDPHSGSYENSALWDIIPCNLLKVNRRFGGLKNKPSQHNASSNLQSWLLVTLSRACLILRLTRPMSPNILIHTKLWLVFGKFLVRNSAGTFIILILSVGLFSLPLANKADNLTAICEPIALRKYESLDVPQPYGPPPPVTGIALVFFFFFFLPMYVLRIQ